MPFARLDRDVDGAEESELRRLENGSSDTPRSRDVKVLAEPLVSRRYALTCRNRDTCYALSSSAAF